MVRRCILVPDTLLASVGGALAEMAVAWAWESFGTLSIEDTVILCKDIEDSYKDCVSMLGSLQSFYGAIPDGYLLADGSIHNEVDYPELYAYLGGAAGTFEVPNLQGRYLYGASVARPLGTQFGTDSETLGITQIPPHEHLIHEHYIIPDLPEGLGAPVPLLSVGIVPLALVPTSQTGGGLSHNNLPTSTSANVAIRAID